MASGTPIVASNIEGFSDVLTDGREGLLAPPRDGQALAGALRRLLADADLRDEMGKQGSDTAQRYSWDRVSAKVLDYYEDVANRAASAHCDP